MLLGDLEALRGRAKPICARGGVNTPMCGRNPRRVVASANGCAGAASARGSNVAVAEKNATRLMVKARIVKMTARGLVGIGIARRPLETVSSALYGVKKARSHNDFEASKLPPLAPAANRRCRSRLDGNGGTALHPAP